jgi:2-polyprenyl-3-methyl-5-hydroxy-6-metoxy-1,4-benzoquinol methylase
MARRLNYHEASFWEERYKQNVCEWFEWLTPPNQFVPLLQDKIPENATVLELGCGTSNLAEKLTTLEY